MPDLPSEAIEIDIEDVEDGSELGQIGFSPEKIVKLIKAFLCKTENRTIVPEPSMHITVSKMSDGYSIVSGTKFTRYYYDFDKKGNLVRRATEWPEGFCSLLDKVPTVTALSRVLNHLLNCGEATEN